MKNSFLLSILSLLIISCNSTPEKKAEPFIDLAGKVYFVGPDLDSNKVEVVAECDCCASEIAFLEDSTFIFGAYCLEEDDYSTGRYEVKNDQLVLSFSGRSVSDIEEMDISEADAEPEYSSRLEVEEVKPFTEMLAVSALKNKKILSLTYEGGTEFGMENTKTTLAAWLKNLENEKILQKLQAGHPH